MLKTYLKLKKKLLTKINIIFVLIFFILQSVFALPALASEIEDPDAVIETGDAVEIIELENDINQNAYAEESSSREEDEIIDEPKEEADECFESNTEMSTEINNTNEADVDNTVSGTAQTGENEITEAENALIDTGDVGIGSSIENDVNYNETAASCQPDCQVSDCECLKTEDNKNEIQVDNLNLASTTNSVELGGSSGSNSITSTTKKAYIETGKVNIYNAIVNYINHNVFGQGKDFLINVFSRYLKTIDLTELSQDEELDLTNPGECSADCEADCTININNTSSSNLENNIKIEASSGDNTITSSSGESVIKTGDINIVNDIVNINNLNITGEDWFFAVVNVFDLLSGDVVLPGIEDGDKNKEIKEKLDDAYSELIVTNSNYSDLINNIEINADTGNNSAKGGSAEIITGDVSTKVDALNLINYNFTGNGWKFVRVNIFGNWDGLVQGLPDNYDYWEDENGVTIYNSDFYYDIFNNTLAELKLENNNNAQTINNIEILASSGSNSIVSNGGGSLINTGNIAIQNSLFNFINSSFSGNSWEFSMVNVFGNWQGNLAFGRPELWITESFIADEPVEKGGFVTYNFLFGNSGDGLAKNVKIIDKFNNKIFAMQNGNGGVDGIDTIIYNIDQLPPNSQGSISYIVQVKEDAPAGQYAADNTAVITSDETDRDYANNTTSGSVAIYGGLDNSSVAAALMTPSVYYPNISIVKTNDAADIVYPGDLVNFKIIIENSGLGVLEKAFVDDVMYNSATDEEINTHFWELDTIYDNEEIIIDYTIKINENIKSGTYINEAYLEGYDSARGKHLTAIASTKIRVENPNFYSDSNLIKPMIDVNKVMRSDNINPGDSVKCSLYATNNGNYPAENVYILDSVIGNYNEWNFPEIKPGEIVKLNYEINIAQGQPAGEYEYFVTVSGDNFKGLDIKYTIVVEEARSGKIYQPTTYLAGNNAPEPEELGIILGAREAKAMGTSESGLAELAMINSNQKIFNLIIPLFILLIIMSLYAGWHIILNKKS